MRALAIADQTALRDIAFLNVRWPHHAKASGYHPIIQGLGPELTVRRLIPGWADWALGPVLRMPKLSNAANVAMAMRRAGVTRLHILEGDRHIRMAATLAKVANVRVACTFHACPDELAKKLKRVPSGCIDIAICVSRCQMPFVRRIAKDGRCFFVPHGVDTDAFQPGEDSALDPDLVLSVGVHRRDLRTLANATRLIRERRPSTRVVLAAPRSMLPRNVDLSMCDVRCDVTDEELVAMYQQATLLLLPLEHATANNAILEAMACGLPIVSTNVGGITDYVTEDFARLCPLADAAEHAKQVMLLLGNASARQAMAGATHANAMRFAWPNVREQLRNLLEEWH